MPEFTDEAVLPLKNSTSSSVSGIPSPSAAPVTVQLPVVVQLAFPPAPVHVNVDSICRCSSGSNRKNRLRKSFRQSSSARVRPHPLLKRLKTSRQEISF